jgi:Fuc2NAc and GlcNAc transferase
MVPDVALILLCGGFAVAVALAGLLLSAPARLKIYAQPNARSFHRQSTPTGGGIVFVLPLVGYLAWLAMQGSPVALAFAVGGAVLALTGLLDDLRDVSPRLRFVVQIAVTTAVAWTLLGESGWWLVVAVALALAWHVNLFNFMDGIDGLAGAQTLVFAVGAHVVGGGVPGWPGDLLWLTAGTVLGFQVVNWPPARIFMGDAGSYFLGLLTGAVAVLLWRQQALALPAALILLAGFWFDATYTLIVRAGTGQAFTQPHKTHLYQRIAAKRGHLWTTVCYLLYALIWLLPLSWLCARHGMALSAGALLWLLPAVTPLAVAAWWLGAGMPDSLAAQHVHEDQRPG